jgi:hypothetical protein
MYQVSNLGKVRNKTREEGEIAKSQEESGYLYVVLRKRQPDGSKKYVRESVHRLVAKAFLPNPENKKTVNHKNHVRNDNRLENLEWATYSEQNVHSKLELYKDEYSNTSYQPEETPDDVWRPTDNVKFHVSNTGKIKNVVRNRMKTITVDGRGYCTVHMSNKVFYIHRLVAKAFVPNFSKDLVVNHIDGNKSNNHVSNLECVTQSQNIMHSYATNTYKNKKRTAVIQVDVNETVVASYKSMAEAEAVVGINRSHIITALKNNSVALGFKWYKTMEDFEKDRPNIKRDIEWTHYKVFQYTLTGELIGEFDSLGEAEAATGVRDGTISKAVNACKDKLSATGGFIWTSSRVPKTELILKLQTEVAMSNLQL